MELRFCFLPLLLALSGQIAWAKGTSTETESLEKLFSMNLVDLSKITVSIANKYDTQLLDTPGSVTLFTREEIKGLGVTELHQLLQFVPGIQVSFEVVSGQESYASVRGSTGFGNDVLYLLNGVRLNSYSNNSVAEFHRYIALENVERVEVIRGPGSSLYGANAFAGVVNIVTSDHTNDLSIEAGEYQSYRASLNLSGRLAEWQLAAFLQNFGNDGQDYDNQFDRFNLADGKTSDPVNGEEVMLSASLGNFKTHARYTHRELEDFYLFSGSLGSSEVKDELRTALVDFQYEHYFNQNLHLDMLASYQYLERDAIAFLAPEDDSRFSSGAFLGGPHFVHRALQLATNFYWQMSSDHRISGGLSYEQGDSPVAGDMANYDLNGPVPVYIGTVEERKQPRFVADKVARINGLYLQDDWQFGERYRLVYGVRYDDYNLAGDAFSPRAALNIKLRQKDRIKLSYSEAFKAPGLNDLYSNNPSLVSNPNLDPTQIKSFELGYHLNLTPLNLSVTAFHNEIEDSIINTPISDSNLNMITRTNIGSQTTDGIEIGLLHQINEQWTLRTAFEHLFRNETDYNSEVTYAAPADFFAKSFGSFALSYENNRWSSTISSTYHSGIETLEDSGSLILFNGIFRYQPNQSLHIYLRGQNLLDEEYYSTASGNGLGEDENNQPVFDIPRKGRWLSLGFRLFFE
ncbi:MAG: TonB-dependent receptor [Pseudomonadales bacterium]|nr:TonB-dependent receptor [Pseudomonadales bacterium]